MSYKLIRTISFQYAHMSS